MAELALEAAWETTAPEAAGPEAEAEAGAGAGAGAGAASPALYSEAAGAAVDLLVLESDFAEAPSCLEAVPEPFRDVVADASFVLY